MAKNGEYEKYPEVFPVGSQVRCESEMYPGKWEYGVVVGHKETRYGVSWAISIETEEGADGRPGALVDFDYRYLDVEDSRNSLVRLVKK